MLCNNRKLAECSRSLAQSNTASPPAPKRGQTPRYKLEELCRKLEELCREQAALLNMMAYYKAKLMRHLNDAQRELFTQPEVLRLK